MTKTKSQKKESIFIEEIQTRTKELENIDCLISEGSIKHFTKDQLEAFIFHLSKYAKRKAIINFTQPVDFVCYEYKHKGIFLSSEQKRQCREKNNILIRDAESVVNRIKRLISGKDLSTCPRTLSDMAVMDDDPEGKLYRYSHFRNIMERRSLRCVPPLINFIEDLKMVNEKLNAPNPLGRGKSTSLEIVNFIKEYYVRYIGNASAYPDGGFYIAVQLTLESLGLPYKNPSRLIREVLKKPASAK